MNLLGAHGWKGSITDHFDGERFHNLSPTVHSVLDFAKWIRTRKKVPWPRQVPFEQHPKPPSRVSDTTSIRVTFINHATVLVQMCGLNFLTDPVWSKRCSPVGFAGPMRVKAPGVSLDDLPPIDVVLLSHNHYDHMDIDTLRKLHRRDRCLVLSGLGNAEYMTARGIPNCLDMDWWQVHQLGQDLGVVFTPAQHFSSRSATDRDKTLWGGFMVHSPAGRVFFAGDTGYGPHFRMIHDRLGSPRMALLPIGAYEPRWFMRPVHMNPADAVLAFQDLKAEQALGIHFGTFQLTDEGHQAPVEDLAAALKQAAVEPGRFAVIEHGDAITLNAL